MRQICVRFIDMKALGEHAVLEVREFPACQHPARVHRVARLCLHASPVGRDGRDDHTVAGPKIPNKAARFHDLAHCLVTEDHVMPLADRALPDRVDV